VSLITTSQLRWDVVKKDRILYPISLPPKSLQNYPLFKEIIFFGKVTKELVRILSIYIRSLKEDIHNLFLYLSKKCIL
jgi:hypothetical protein